MQRCPGVFKIGGCGDEQAPVVGQAHADQVRIGQVADPHRAVVGFADDVDDPVAEVQRHIDFRMLGKKPRHQRRHVAPSETGRRGGAQIAAGLDATCADAGFGVGQIGEQALAVLEEGAALVGQRQSAGGSQQQLDAQTLLQRVEPSPDDRRRHPFGLRRGGQAAALRNRSERFDLLELVHSEPSAA